MRVEVLYFEGCPNHAPTVERVRAELLSHGLPKKIEEVEIHNQAEAGHSDFWVLQVCASTAWTLSGRHATSRVSE